ncbi:class I SAM-dependent methyltransferase [Candidatus Stoquefichus massiliensis]|uniref:class I SAM-dependent methyltransferase n=1 Tax=Candidatus Stoquefichus massiliensis TaxID=1470350 RepID=UPI00047F6B09|nr:class I SAM-dependent methyltransferase [Candidatus Stoquefichus massiliensis]
MKNRKELSKQAFNQQALTYDHDIKGVHARKLYPHMLQEMIHIYGQDILDLGCGTAELMYQVIREDSSRNIIGLDLSEEMLKIAENKLGNKATFILGDAEHLPFADQSFDIVYCNDSFHHYPHPQFVLSEVYRVLKPGGTLLIGDCYQIGVARWIMNLFMRFSTEGDIKIYSKKEMYALMSEYFHELRWYKVDGESFIMKGKK